MNRHIVILAHLAQSKPVFNVWASICLLLLMMALAGCSGVISIVAGLGAGAQAELLTQTMPTTGLPTIPVVLPEDDGEDVDALIEQAGALADEGETAAALALADKAASLAPTNAKVHWMRGLLLYRLNDREGALAAYELAVQSGMDWPYGYLTLSNLHEEMGNTADELAALNKTIDLALAQADGSADPVLMLAFQYRSELRAKSGDLPGAIADLETSLSIAPWEYGNFKALNNLRHRLAARQAAFAEDPRVLLADLNDRLAAEPDDVQALLDRGFLTLQLAFIDNDAANLNAAYQDFTAALTFDPERAEAYHGRALATWMASAAVTDVSGTDIDGIEGAAQEAALADLETALSLSPDMVAARHDRGVMRLRAWFDEVGMMDVPPERLDEALAAAVSDLNFVVQQSPDWAVARLNRGMVNLVHFMWLIERDSISAEEGDEGIRLLKETVADATWLIDQDASSIWAYYMRLMAIFYLDAVTRDTDPNLVAYMMTDYQRILELGFYLSDDPLLQLADQARLSLQIAPAPPISSGALEFGNADIYTNADYGLRLKAWGPVTTATANGTLWLHMADDFDVLDVLVMKPTLGDRSVEMWLADTLLSLIPPEKLAEQPPLQTQYGPATLFIYHGGIEAVLAILPVGDYVVSFEYSPGPATTSLSFETRPPDLVLAEFIYGLTVDGVMGDQPLDPRLGPVIAESIRSQGWDAMMRGDYEEAVRLLRLALDYNPDDAVALNNLAWTLAYDLQTELDAALGYALRAVELVPDPSYYDTLGMVYYRLQQYDEALAAYTEALTLDPDLAASLRGRADVYFELGEIEKAIQDLEHYLDVEPSSEDADDIRIRIEALRTQ
ncbi:MAG: tetratricopeptide repeat protein [Caldilineaceae bacterium]|nr:tetratricopeptide repeat protein [Caldilineaceae bacterium]